MAYLMLPYAHGNQNRRKTRFLRPGTAEVESRPLTEARPETRRGGPSPGSAPPVGRPLAAASRPGRSGRSEESWAGRSAGQDEGRATPPFGGGAGSGTPGLGVHDRAVDDAAGGRPDPAPLPRPIPSRPCGPGAGADGLELPATGGPRQRDRKSTRLNSSHLVISYAVFCLKKKKIKLMS